MAKKKHTKSNPKVQEAQNRNKYLRQLQQLYSQIHPDLFSSFTKEQLNILYSVRGTMIRSRSEEYIPGYILEFCDDYIRDRMKESSIYIIPGKVKISLLEYSFYFFPLEVWGEQMKEQFAGKDWYQEIMKAKEERIDKFENMMNVFALLLMRHISNHQYTMYYIEYKIFQDNSMKGLPRLNQKFILKGYVPREARKTFNDKNKKPRYGLELVYNNHKMLCEDEYEPLTPFTMLPSKLGVKMDGEEKPLPVIILQHALRRLEERLGCLVTGYVESHIIPSLLRGEVHETPDKGLLVAYYLEKNKAGYLYVDIDDEAILIRTFLFLTNNSTPEGQKLRKHIGLRKEDVKYLNIDRLTPLMESDLLEDEELCKILQDAGCESLLELCEELKDNEYWNKTEEKKQLAKKLKDYALLGEKGDDR